MLTSNSESMRVAVLRNTRKSIVRFSNEHSKKRNLYSDNILQLDAFFRPTHSCFFFSFCLRKTIESYRIVVAHFYGTERSHSDGLSGKCSPLVTRRNRRLSKSQRFYKYLYIISET